MIRKLSNGLFRTILICTECRMRAVRDLPDDLSDNMIGSAYVPFMCRDCVWRMINEIDKDIPECAKFRYEDSIDEIIPRPEKGSARNLREEIKRCNSSDQQPKKCKATVRKEMDEAKYKDLLNRDWFLPPGTPPVRNQGR